MICARLRRFDFERLLPFSCPRMPRQPVAETLRSGDDVTKSGRPFDYRRLACDKGFPDPSGLDRSRYGHHRSQEFGLTG